MGMAITKFLMKATNILWSHLDASKNFIEDF